MSDVAKRQERSEEQKEQEKTKKGVKSGMVTGCTGRAAGFYRITGHLHPSVIPLEKYESCV